MGGVTLVWEFCAGCGLGSGIPVGEVLCWECAQLEARRLARAAHKARQLALASACDPLRCNECGTQMLVAVPKGVCGLCDESWVEIAA